MGPHLFHCCLAPFGKSENTFYWIQHLLGITEQRETSPVLQILDGH
jgi:hypothetical protein